MRKFLTIDESEFPIVLFRYENIVPALEEFLQAQVDTENLVARCSNFIAIIDLTHMPFLPQEYRIAQGKWATRFDQVIVERKVKIVFCTPSTLARLMLKGVFIFKKPSVPYVITSSLEKAYGVAKRQFQSNAV